MEINLDKTANILNETIFELSKLIKGTRWENNVYLVGGAVRDIIMKRPIKDIDICVTLEDGGIKFANWVCKETSCYQEGNNPCVFSNYGTAKFNLTSINKLSKVDIECVHTRKEWYADSKSRNPSTIYGTLEDDSLRRDLTINALYLNISNFKVIDPTGKGLNDIESNILRTPSEANKVYCDDPLRMLRAIRFSCRYNWDIEKNTWLGIIKNAYRIKIISQERITDEINKILLSDKPSIGIKKLHYCGLLKFVLPVISNLIGVEQNKYHFGDVFEHTLSVVDKSQPILENRIAALLHDCAKPFCKTTDIFGVNHFYQHEIHSSILARSTLKIMKYPNNLINKVDIAIKNHMKFKSSNGNCPSNKSIRKFVANVGENIDLVLDIIDADNKSHAEKYCYNNQVNIIRNKIKELKENENMPNKIILPINGKDIMSYFNLKSGPIIGTILDKIKDAYYKNPKITRKECFNIALLILQNNK